MKLTSFFVLILTITCFNALAGEPIGSVCTGTSLPYGKNDSIQSATKQALEDLGTCLETSQTDCLSFGGTTWVESPNMSFIEETDFTVAMASQRVTCFFETEETVGNHTLRDLFLPYGPHHDVHPGPTIDDVPPHGLRDDKPRDGVNPGPVVDEEKPPNEVQPAPTIDDVHPPQELHRPRSGVPQGPDETLDFPVEHPKPSQW